jgi:hypothetical protein
MLRWPSHAWRITFLTSALSVVEAVRGGVRQAALKSAAPGHHAPKRLGPMLPASAPEFRHRRDNPPAHSLAARLAVRERERADDACFAVNRLIAIADDAFSGVPVFDAAIGHFVSIHQADPIAMIRRGAAAVRCAGVVAFHELVSRTHAADRPSRRAGRTMRELRIPCPGAACRRRCAAGRLSSGLPMPYLIWDSVAGCPASPVSRWLALTYRCMLPHILRLGLTLADTGDPTPLLTGWLRRRVPRERRSLHRPRPVPGRYGDEGPSATATPYPGRTAATFLTGTGGLRLRGELALVRRAHSTEASRCIRPRADGGVAGVPASFVALWRSLTA